MNFGERPLHGKTGNDMKGFWKDKAVFVTGASGFVGSNLTKFLVERGARVVCLERDEVHPNSLDLLGFREKVAIVHGEVEDLGLLTRILNEYEIYAVFHLAAQAIVGAANRSPISTFETNIRGTYMLLEACRLNPTVSRVVVASSDKAYGPNPTLPYREDFPLQGIFPYDVSKSCADLLCRSFAVTFKMPIVVTRSANIYGPADLNLSRIIPGTIVSVLKDERPMIRSDGTPLREFIFVDDVCAAYLTLAENIDKSQGEAFNIGTNEPVQILDLTQRIIAAAGKAGQIEPNILLKQKIKHEIDAQYLIADKLMSSTGWKAEVSLDNGLQKSIEWYNQHLKKIA
jgi:CDP-glucose 4,6-dehydratase